MKERRPAQAEAMRKYWAAHPERRAAIAKARSDINRDMAPESRRARSVAQRRRWDQLSDKARAEINERRIAGLRAYLARPEVREHRWQQWRERNPVRAAVWDRIHAAIASGDVVPEPCDTCGGEARPWVDYATETVKGWRCAACWRATRGRA